MLRPLKVTWIVLCHVGGGAIALSFVCQGVVVIGSGFFVADLLTSFHVGRSGWLFWYMLCASCAAAYVMSRLVRPTYELVRESLDDHGPLEGALLAVAAAGYFVPLVLAGVAFIAVFWPVAVWSWLSGRKTDAFREVLEADREYEELEREVRSFRRLTSSPPARLDRSRFPSLSRPRRRRPRISARLVDHPVPAHEAD